MLEFLDTVTQYISGLYTLPWILIGFILTILFTRLFGEGFVNRAMKKNALVLLYIFVPLLLFRILINVDFGSDEISFTIACFVILSLMYILAYLFANNKAKKLQLKGKEKNHFIKTVLTNQGRSSAFVGGAMLAIPDWQVQTLIYMIIGAIFLFAIIPGILSHIHKKEIKKSDETDKIKALPWYLKIFPLYLFIFAFAAIAIHGFTGFTVKDPTDLNRLFVFLTQCTIPAALYYVGAGIHPRDLKIDEMKKLFSLKNGVKSKEHWSWIRAIFFLTVLITPLITLCAMVPIYIAGFITSAWFAVIVINSILPITSTNMFLVPYGINKKVTALSVTWTTIVCVPLVVILITVFGIYFT
jgi:hypothetical protein